jgi:ribosomal protein L11 methyltransferase
LKPIVIVIQPSMGFGTAHHATTRLCLMALQQIQLDTCNVLDIGAGSGVLSITASRLGAPRVVGIDVDVDAIQAMTENLRLNRGASVIVREGDFRSASLEPFNVILANLTGALLRDASHRIMELTVPGGRMILSGFTKDEETSVLGAFARARVTSRTEEDEWVCVSLMR